MELNINDFRDWLYDRIEEDDGVVIENTATFNGKVGERGAACPIHEYATDTHAVKCEVMDREISYVTHRGGRAEEDRLPLWVERFNGSLDMWFGDMKSVPDAYDCLAILDEIEVGRRGKQRKS